MRAGKELPNLWANTTLQHVAEIHDNLREPVNAEERERRVGPYPYYGATGQVGWIDSFLMDGEYVLLGEDGAPFLDPTRPKAYLVSGKSWVNNHAHVLRGKLALCRNKFLLHALNAADYRGYANGTTRLKLTQAAMRRLPIRLPPLGEQDRIVEKIEELFSELDAGVSALERVKANLKRFRAAVLKAAVEGKLTEEWRRRNPATETADKLLDRIHVERQKNWEQEQQRVFAEAGRTPTSGWQAKYRKPAEASHPAMDDLPLQWRWTSMDSLIVAGPQNGAYYPKSSYGSGIGIIRIDDYQNHYSRSAAELRLVAAPPDDIQGYGLRIRDVLINRVNSMTHLGKCLLVEERHLPAIFESNMMRLTLAEAVSAGFVTLYLKSHVGRRRLTANAKWAVNQASINQTDVATTPVPLPPIAEQRLIVAEVERRLSVLEVVEAEVEHGLKRASRLRQAILKRAFEGKLVPQDPVNEPASVLLATLKESQRTATGQTSSTTPPRGRNRQNVHV